MIVPFEESPVAELAGDALPPRATARLGKHYTAAPAPTTASTNACAPARCLGLGLGSCLGLSRCLGLGLGRRGAFCKRPPDNLCGAKGVSSMKRAVVTRICNFWRHCERNR